MHGIIVLNRNGNRRPTTRRRRKKVSPFKTITLWLLFLLFTISATVFFLLLVYLDLISSNKNSRELAICCGAFGVSLLTALRVWVSLPDEESSPHRATVEREPVAPSCDLHCQCSVQRVSTSRALTVYQHVNAANPSSEEISLENFLLLPENYSHENQPAVASSHHTFPPSYTDCCQGIAKSSEEAVVLPPTYSSLNLADDQPPQYEETLTITV
eukprot:TRINITY_DN11677_c0_g1_i1.p1 TRINITY_DN11677_c0_g1~~TRINITY_DN11677_c0_g1_i1.p1  ORF type:complete len:214 (-),score=57.67 TRINITY_DN11677_c0_g1_i1:87-728(-)